MEPINDDELTHTDLTVLLPLVINEIMSLRSQPPESEDAQRLPHLLFLRRKLITLIGRKHE